MYSLFAGKTQDAPASHKDAGKDEKAGETAGTRRFSRSPSPPQKRELPSGYLTVCYESWTIYIDAIPINMVVFHC